MLVLKDTEGVSKRVARSSRELNVGSDGDAEVGVVSA